MAWAVDKTGVRPSRSGVRIHLRLVDREQAVLAEATIESASISIGSADVFDFHHPRIGARLDIRSDGYHAQATGRQQTIRLQRKNVLQMPSGDSLLVDLYPRPDAVPRVRGLCPSCGDVLVDRQVGGAYRAVASEERRCPSCETRVLAIRAAPNVLGRFTDRTADDWVHVTVASRCPSCLDSMSRAVFSGDRGSVTVERCTRCQLVVIGSEDHGALRG
jgi:hypothetical protein